MCRMLEWTSKVANNWRESAKTKGLGEHNKKASLDSIWKNWLVNDDMTIGKRTGEVLDSEFDYTCYKDKF